MSNMNRAFCLAVLGSLCVLFTIVSDAMTDSEIASEIAELSLQNGRIGSDAAWLLQQCGGDSNRICRIAENVYRNSSDARTRGTALSFIWRYGGTQQVPFLDACVTNAVGALYAMRILNKIEGFTSNSIVRVGRYHSVTNQGVISTDRNLYSDRAMAVKDLQSAASGSEVDGAIRNFARDYVISYASNNCYQIYTADQALLNLDPTYRNSKRRLGLLRLAQPFVLGPFGPEYVTNAIHELVAYPEANLPE